MKLLQLQSVKLILVVLGAVSLTTLGILASDELQGVSSRLSGTVLDASRPCGSNAELIAFGTHSICMDAYEAAPADTCIYTSPQSSVETSLNVAQGSCAAVSEGGREPWRFVNYTQASQLCAREGKRLPTNTEWYKVALGLADTAGCFVGNGSAVGQTGSGTCMTPTGIHNIVGNVWEWMGDTITEGQFAGRTLPSSGYVHLVDEAGVVIETGDTARPDFGEDYAWLEDGGVRGMLRGGFYGSGSDGGVFAQNGAATLDFAAAGVGFRCVHDVW